MEPDPDLQFAQATLNLLRHVAMSAPVPVIQHLKNQLEARYQELLEPLHPGVDYLVRNCLEGEFELILPMVQGLLPVGSAPSIGALEEALGGASAAPAPSPKPAAPVQRTPGPFRSAGRAYVQFFQEQQKQDSPGDQEPSG
jgi:hypothetical protein